MRDDPFATLGAIDQKLFGKQSDSLAKETAKDPLPTNQPRKEGTLEPWNQPSKEPRKAPVEQSKSFNLNDRPDRQNTYEFTTKEMYAIDDLKRDLEREYDLKVTKYDLIRCGVHMLLEDYALHGDTSAVVDRLRKKRA